MASVHKEIVVDASASDVWAALREWGALHERLAPGFVTDTRLDGGDRIVTFANGAVVREVLIDLDDEACRLVWTADLMPDELAPRTAQMMEQGTSAIKKTLEATAVRS